MNYFAYLRVSTDAQDVANQRHGVQDYCDRNGIKPQWTEDSVSSRVAWNERKIGGIIEQMKQGDTIIVSEVSRLARSTADVLNIARAVQDKGGSIYVVKQSMKLVGENDLHAKITLTVLGLAAEIEREMISQRTREALSRKKAEGVKLGRPEGKAENLKLDENAKQIKELLDKNISKVAIAKIIECSPTTLRKWLKERGVSN